MHYASQSVSTRAQRTRLRRGRGIAVTAATIFALLIGSLVAAPAYAAPANLTLSKVVNGEESVQVVADQEFTYTVQVGCSDSGCENATMIDTLPAQFDGFAILGTQVSPASFPSTTSYDGCSTVVTTACELTVSFDQQLNGEGTLTGINAGETYSIAVTLKVPAGLSPAWSSNGIAVTNTATATADNAPTVSDSADVTVTIPIVVDTAVTKAWSPASQQYSPGVASTLSLTTANTSNVAASSLSLQDPSIAVEGAVALAAANPFALVDFDGFGTVVAPQGADRVQVDAYVLVAGTWTWVSGSPSTIATIALPVGVDAAEVGGIRVTFSDSTSGAMIIAGGSAGSVPVTVVQRSTNRQTGASLVLGSSVTNSVTGTVTVPGQPPVNRSATAPYAIGGLTVAVDAGKQITPNRIPAGTSAVATITGRNASNGPLASLSLADTDFFTEELAFGGFTSPVTYPTGATGASIQWFYSGGEIESAALPAGSTPTAPGAPAGGHLTGFALTFTGAVAVNATATLNFAVSPSQDFAQAESPRRVTNTVDATAVNPAGTSTDAASAPLDVFQPEIALAIDKTISPAGAVQAGGTVVVQLPTVTSSDSASVTPTSITVEDSLRAGSGDFWNAFNPIAIAPTQVSSGVALLVEYTTDGTTWVTLASVAPSAIASVYQSAIDPGLVPVIEGLRFTFSNPDEFPRGATVAPNIVFEARSTLRSDPGTATSVPDAAASEYENRGFATSTGEVEGPTTITSAPVEDFADASIISFSGAGSLMVDKTWRTPTFAQSKDTINSQSGEQAGTRLGWGVLSTGYSSVTITDSANDEANPQNTVFQAFDLDRIPAISFTADPLLRWDIVSSVELYYGGAWNAVVAPGGSWMNGSGFKGYDLSATESGLTTGVRITIVPNDAARAASTNAVTPPVGSGVATSASGQLRTIDLLWTLRNVVRVPTPPLTVDWVTAGHGYNDPMSSTNTVYNTVGVAGVQNAAAVGPVVDSDSIMLIDQPPGVDVSKVSSATSIPIPNNDDVAPGDYPSVTFSISSSNTSSSRASYLRVTDPQPCAPDSEADCLSAPGSWAIDPFVAGYDTENPFERLTLTDIAFTFNASEISSAASRVTVWLRDSAGTLTTQNVSLQVAAAYAAADLVDVVGVSVVYQGADPANDGGSIASGSTQVMTLTAQVRKNLRSDPSALVTPFTVDNNVFAQSYDPVLFASGAQSTPRDGADDDVALVDGVLGVTASKTISPTTLIEKDRTTPVAVTIGATQGASTVATNEVTLEDSDPEFWSSFRLTGLGAVTPPAGSDQVRVDVQINGSPTWETGVTGSAAALPAIDLATVTGIRFVFNRIDAGVFSHSAPPAGWSAQAVLQVMLLDDLRGTSTPVPFPSTVDNKVTTRSERYDVPAFYAPATADATDNIVLDPGSFQLDVSKSPRNNQHTVFPGDSIPWTLTFSNEGTGYLTIDDLVDTLPAELIFDAEPPVFATSAGGTLSTDVAYTYDPLARTLTFAWPDGADRMSPDETFTITLGLILAPGLTPADRATNQMVVTTAQALTACTNTSGNAQGVMSGLAANDCGTTNYVSPIAGASLVTMKGVRGDITGGLAPSAVNVSNPQANCLPDAEGFYRSPCAANSVIGGTDEWKLEAVNSGTTSYTSLTFVDPLPTPGDRMLATGSARGSTFRPVFEGDAGLQISGAPAGTTQTVQVSTTADVCIGSGASAWPTDPSCSTATWANIGSYAGEWADVTGLRIVLDFTTSAATSLAPGEQVAIKYQTINTVETAAMPDRAPSEVPVTGNFAWNQFGALATLTSGAPIQRAPTKAGVTLAGGPLEVTKTISGAAAAFAPDEFLVDVACTIDATTLDLGVDGVLELSSATLYTARIDGIPLGANCVVTEQGALGAFGESGRSGSPASVDVTTSAGNTDPVPASQQVSITNDYAYGGLSVSKTVTTEATVGGFGPFQFELSCESALADPVSLDASDEQFELVAGATHTVLANTVPIGAECLLTEIDSDGADAVTISGAGVSDNGDGTATVTVGAASAIAVDNAFEAGTLSVLKVLSGPGTGGYGTGPFTAAVRCVYGVPEQVLYDDAVAIVPGVATLVSEVFPVGTECSVNEVDTGGANSHVDPPAVIITGPAAGETIGSVTADVTNYFFVGSLEVEKVRTGDGVAQFGAGPFQVHVTCTWDRDGVTMTIPLVDGGLLELTAAGGYTASIQDLLVGASCVVEETDAGLATSTTLLPIDGTVTILDPAVASTPATVVITNQFDVGHLSLEKTARAFVVEQGSGVPYTITVTNDGQIDALDFTVSDELPKGGTVVTASDGGVLLNGVVTWEIDELRAGDSRSLQLVLAYDQPGQYVNLATVQQPPGPWEPPTLALPCDNGMASCATVLITALAWTGSTVGWAWLVALLALFSGATLLLVAAIRRRQPSS
ncbi:MAG: hypothetical protein JWP85_1877 [Rhodoglobus sp.]|nr:hypothetical protein [Rhodoglobus sp.]